jgi:hypothetical protein
MLVGSGKHVRSILLGSGMPLTFLGFDKRVKPTLLGSWLSC